MKCTIDSVIKHTCDNNKRISLVHNSDSGFGRVNYHEYIFNTLICVSVHSQTLQVRIEFVLQTVDNQEKVTDQRTSVVSFLRLLLAK